MVIAEKKVHQELSRHEKSDLVDVTVVRQGAQETLRGFRDIYNHGWVNFIREDGTTTTLNLEDITRIELVGSPAAHDVGHVT